MLPCSASFSHKIKPGWYRFPFFFASLASPRPQDPVQRKDSLPLFLELPRLDNLEPAVIALREATGETTAATLSAGRTLLLCSTKLRQSFLQEAQLLDPGWPGKRVDVALHQLALAHEIFKEFLLRIFDIHTGDELENVIQRFQTAHLQLKDGGNGISPILIPERQDLLDEWHHVDEAWNEFKGYQDSLTPMDPGSQRCFSLVTQGVHFRCWKAMNKG